MGRRESKLSTLMTKWCQPSFGGIPDNICEMEQFVGKHSISFTLPNQLYQFQFDRMVLGEEKYLKCVRKYPEAYPGPNEPFEDNFEFSSLPYSVYRRFIELLYPATNHFLRKTSKNNYQQCLDLRGIEVGYLSWGGSPEYHGQLFLDGGRMILNLREVQRDWAKWLVVTGNFYTVARAIPYNAQLSFVKKYEMLHFCGGYAEQLDYLIHPTLKEVCINDYHLELDKLSSFLNKLNVCQHLEKIDIWNVNVTSTAAFKQLKQQLEQLFQRHPHAQITCNLGYKKYFKIHENVLCHCPAPSVFVKDYSFEELLQ